MAWGPVPTGPGDPGPGPVKHGAGATGRGVPGTGPGAVGLHTILRQLTLIWCKVAPLFVNFVVGQAG